MPSPLPTVSVFQRHHGGAGNLPQAPEEAEEEVEDEGEIVLPEHPHVPAAAHAEEGNHRVRGGGSPGRTEPPCPRDAGALLARGHTLPALRGSLRCLFLI